MRYIFGDLASRVDSSLVSPNRGPRCRVSRTVTHHDTTHYDSAPDIPSLSTKRLSVSHIVCIIVIVLTAPLDGSTPPSTEVRRVGACRAARNPIRSRPDLDQISSSSSSSSAPPPDAIMGCTCRRRVARGGGKGKGPGGDKGQGSGQGDVAGGWGVALGLECGQVRGLSSKGKGAVARARGLQQGQGGVARARGCSKASRRRTSAMPSVSSVRVASGSDATGWATRLTWN